MVGEKQSNFIRCDPQQQPELNNNLSSVVQRSPDFYNNQNLLYLTICKDSLQFQYRTPNAHVTFVGM